MTTSADHGAIATIHGYPRHGDHRELKNAVEASWWDLVSAEELLDATRATNLLAEVTEAPDLGLRASTAPGGNG